MDARVRGQARTLDDLTISFEVFRAGEPIVLGHGTGLSRAVWSGLGYVDALRRYRVITLDFRGHGRSSKPSATERYSAPLLGSDVVAVLDHLEIESAHFLGYSLGGRAGFELLATSPERVRSFISLGGTHRAARGEVATMFFDGYDDAIARGGMDEFIAQWAKSKHSPVDAETALAFRQNDPMAMRAVLAALEEGPGISIERLSLMQTPTLLIAGRLDRPRWESAREASSAMPRARMVELPEHDHSATLRDRATVVDLMLPFLDNVGDG